MTERNLKVSPDFNNMTTTFELNLYSTSWVRNNVFLTVFSYKLHVCDYQIFNGRTILANNREWLLHYF